LAAVTAAATRTASLAAAARNAGSGISATVRLSLSASLARCVDLFSFFFFLRWGRHGWIGVAGTNGKSVGVLATGHVARGGGARLVGLARNPLGSFDLLFF
jgi:UDP-N-acetylmuramoylalanine-D-glutamate ligase